MALTELQKQDRSEYLERNLEITECSQRKPYVFISYASDDWETVFKTAVVPMQQQYGLRVYADKAFDKVNDRWIVPMLRNVRGADVVVAFVSQSYIESYACFLELLTAVNNKKQVVFVSLEQELDLGDTTDQPNVERGVKAEILNQGQNIATNVNNTSNDLMRAMKSAYTSISTLLEQDALSKYDISDAFINFFRDAAINRKTINDLNAVRRTIESVSRDVFDPELVVMPESAPAPVAEPEPAPTPVAEPEPAPAVESEPAAVPEPADVSEPVDMSEPADAPEPVVDTPQEAPAVEPADTAETVSEAEPATVPEPALVGAGAPVTDAAQPEPVSRPLQNAVQPAPQAPVQPQPATGAAAKKLPDKKILIGAAAAVAALVLVLVFALGGGPKNVTDRQYTLSSGSAGLYTGEWKDDKPNGYGTFTREDGAVYEGEWADGLPNGQGTAAFTDGEVYEGEWKDNLRNGTGTNTYANGDVYEGEFKENHRDGQGVLTEANGTVWNGEWSGGSFVRGVETWADGTVREGSWDVGTGRFSSGKQTTVDGDVYEGTWNVTTGWFANGTITYANGDVYEGHRENNNYNGQGKMTYADGRVFEGEWKDGRLYNGTLTSADGNTLFEGEFDLETGLMRNGKLTLNTEIGTTILEGEFNETGSRLIRGRKTDPSGDYRDGSWDPETGNFISGTARATQSDGRVYEGAWSNGTANGHGTLYYTDGTSRDGVWKDGSLVSWDDEG